MRLVFFFSLSLLVACADRWEGVPFKKQALTSETQEAVFRFDTVFSEQLGDTAFRTVSIFKVDSNVWYRLREQVQLFSDYGIDRERTDLIDSSHDGGRTWFNVLPLPFRRTFAPRLLVGDKYLYVFSYDSLLIVDRAKKLVVSNKRVNAVFTQLDRMRNVLVMVTVPGVYHTIRDTTILSLQSLHDVEPGVFYSTPSYTYRKATLYRLSEAASELVRGLRLKIIDSVGEQFTTELSKFSTYGASERNGLIGMRDFLYLIGRIRDSTKENTQLLLYRSQDNGKTWQITSAKLPPIISQVHHFVDDTILGLSSSLYNRAIWLSELPALNPPGVVTDSTFEGVIPSVVDESNTFLLRLADTATHTSTFVRPVRYSLDSVCKPKEYSITETPSTITIKVKLNRPPFEKSGFNLQLYGAHSFNMRQKNKQIHISKANRFRAIDADSTLWECSFPISEINAVAGQGYHLLFDFYDNTFHQQYNLGEKIFTPVSFSEKFPTAYRLLQVAVLVLILLLVLWIVYWIEPYWIYVIYTKTSLFRSIAGKVKFGELFFDILDMLTLSPLFVNSDRVTEAWADRNEAVGRYFRENEETVRSYKSDEFVPMRLKIISKNNSQDLNEPQPKDLDFLFHNKERLCIQVVGGGGMGKTTFAIQLCRWLMDPNYKAYFNNQSWLPMLIEEETTDLPKTIQEKLIKITGRKVEMPFLKMLLSRKRLVILIDALSERSNEMQQHITGIYGAHRINALLTTSRDPLDFDIPEQIECRPLPMDSTAVFRLVKNILQKSELNVFANEIEKVDVFRKILVLFNSKKSGSVELAVTPVFVELIARKIILFAEQLGNQANIERVLAGIPQTIPDIFTDYIEAVNPTSGNNVFSDKEILRYAEIVAECSVGDNYIPSDADLYAVVRPAILANSMNSKGDVIERLIDNGIVKTLTYLNTTFIRFELDPVAEYLAAIYKAKRCGPDHLKWDQLYQDIRRKNMPGFLAILDTIYETYHERLKWPSKPFVTDQNAGE